MVKFVVNVVKTKDTDVALHIYNNKIPMKLNEQYAIENKENVVQSGFQKDNQSGLWEC